MREYLPWEGAQAGPRNRTQGSSFTRRPEGAPGGVLTAVGRDRHPTACASACPLSRRRHPRAVPTSGT